MGRMVERTWFKDSTRCVLPPCMRPMTILGTVSFESDDQQIALGWLRGRRKGFIARATDWHGDLTRFLAAVFRARHAAAPCAAIVIRRGAIPLQGRLCGTLRALLCVTGTLRDPVFEWDRESARQEPLFAVGFYQTDEDAGVEARRNVAKLTKLGLSWGYD